MSGRKYVLWWEWFPPRKAYAFPVACIFLAVIVGILGYRNALLDPVAAFVGASGGSAFFVWFLRLINAANAHE